MGLNVNGGLNPYINAFGADKVKKPAEDEQQGETKTPELNMTDNKGAETKTNVTFNGLDALATYGKANLGKSLQATGEINGTDAPTLSMDAKYGNMDGQTYNSVDEAWEAFYQRKYADGDQFKIVHKGRTYYCRVMAASALHTMVTTVDGSNLCLINEIRNQ